MMNSIIVPSIIARSQLELEKRIKKVSVLKPRIVQLDIMDGEFVPHTSLEFDFKLPKSVKYEAHLMIDNPLAWMKHNHGKISSVIFHYESEVHMHKAIKLAKKHKKKVGIAVNPETDVEDIVQYLKLIDKVLVMTVHPGKYGARFIPSTLEKIRNLRNLSNNLTIQADGSINDKTIISCLKAGANQFVVGSHLQKANDVRLVWNKLKNALAS